MFRKLRESVDAIPDTAICPQVDFNGDGTIAVYDVGGGSDESLGHIRLVDLENVIEAIGAINLSQPLSNTFRILRVEGLMNGPISDEDIHKAVNAREIWRVIRKFLQPRNQ